MSVNMIKFLYIMYSKCVFNGDIDCSLNTILTDFVIQSTYVELYEKVK